MARKKQAAYYSRLSEIGTVVGVLINQPTVPVYARWNESIVGLSFCTAFGAITQRNHIIIIEDYYSRKGMETLREFLKGKRDRHEAAVVDLTKKPAPVKSTVFQYGNQIPVDESIFGYSPYEPSRIADGGFSLLTYAPANNAQQMAHIATHRRFVLAYGMDTASVTFGEFWQAIKTHGSIILHPKNMIGSGMKRMDGRLSADEFVARWEKYITFVRGWKLSTPPHPWLFMDCQAIEERKEGIERVYDLGIITNSDVIQICGYGMQEAAKIEDEGLVMRIKAEPNPPKGESGADSGIDTNQAYGTHQPEEFSPKWKGKEVDRGNKAESRALNTSPRYNILVSDTPVSSEDSESMGDDDSDKGDREESDEIPMIKENKETRVDDDGWPEYNPSDFESVDQCGRNLGVQGSSSMGKSETRNEATAVRNTVVANTVPVKTAEFKKINVEASQSMNLEELMDKQPPGKVLVCAGPPPQTSRGGKWINDPHSGLNILLTPVLKRQLDDLTKQQLQCALGELGKGGPPGGSEFEDAFSGTPDPDFPDECPEDFALYAREYERKKKEGKLGNMAFNKYVAGAKMMSKAHERRRHSTTSGAPELDRESITTTVKSQGIKKIHDHPGDSSLITDIKGIEKIEREAKGHQNKEVNASFQSEEHTAVTPKKRRTEVKGDASSKKLKPKHSRVSSLSITEAGSPMKVRGRRMVPKDRLHSRQESFDQAVVAGAMELADRFIKHFRGFSAATAELDELCQRLRGAGKEGDVDLIRSIARPFYDRLCEAQRVSDPYNDQSLT